MEKSRTKIISEVETDSNVVAVKKPFKLIKDQRRRYIRLEIDAPVEFTILKAPSEGFFPEDDGPRLTAHIINISAGGVLLESASVVPEGSLIVLKMTLKEVEAVDKILGLIKRADHDGESCLLGVEFISRDYLEDFLSRAEIDIMNERVMSFDEVIRRVLNKYVYYKRVSGETGK